jgi:Carboxypeptidase regulatory-like domain
MRKVLFATFLTLLGIMLVFAPATMLHAQRLTGSATITILDPSGASVPDARAIITSKEKGISLEIRSRADGIAVVPDLAPGDYSVAVQHEGFKTASTVLTVRVGVNSSLVLRLELGAITTEVMVQAESVTVDTTRSTVQAVVTANLIDNLPLNGRNFLDLAQMAPGVQIVDGGLFDPTKNQMTGVSVGGRSGRSTRIQVDGVDITDETVGTTVMNLTNESVQEFGIQQSSLDVSTDLTSSGAVNILTRSGTNTWHGSGFGFFRRSEFAANNAPIICDSASFAAGICGTSDTPTNTAKPPFSRDNYGGRLGGAIIKNRLFVEAEYEKLQQVGANTTNVGPFPQFTGAFGVPVNEHMGGGRVDFNLTSKMKLFYRFNHDDNIGVTGFGGVGLSAFANSNSANSHVAGWDYSTGSWVHSVRFSFLKFINGIVDGNALAGTPVLPAAVNITGLGGFTYGPNANAPQNTYQQNRQTKYDASWVKGHHNFQFGAEYNRVDEAGFASFFGLGPRIVAPFSAGVAAVPFNANGASDPLNYSVSSLFLGNGLGAGSEKPALGFPDGGFINNRIGIYGHDTWKITRDFTLNGGLRWDFDDGLSNADLARAPLISTFDPELGGKPRNDKTRFAPQLGFAWDVAGNGKTVLRGGGGIYYETNIFNNLLFDRAENLPPGLGNDTPNPSTQLPFVIDPRNGAPLFDFSTQCVGLANNDCFHAAVGNVIPFALQAQSLLQAASAELAANWPPPGVPPKFNQDLGAFGGVSIIDPHYTSPYGAQINFGVQREIRPGLVLNVDYVMNRGVHFGMLKDRNRVGAANTFNLAAGQAAIALTLNQCGAANVDQAIASCPALEGPGAGATIDDFANNGLGAGSGLDGFAFGGTNRNFRQMTVIEPDGLSRYQGLQMQLTGKLGSWGPFKNASTNVTYALSSFKTSSIDQDFLDNAVTNDDPTAFYGPSNLDRRHQVGVSLLTELPYHFRFSTTTQYKTSEPSSMFLPTGNGAVDIFEDDLNGDGSVLNTTGGDPIPGTGRGAYSRTVHAGNLNQVLNNFNTNVAGTLTPAGQVVVANGLMTAAQMTALGGVVESVPLAFHPVDNPNFATTDLRLSWRLSIKDRLSIEPTAEAFNVFNRDNRIGQSSIGRGGNTGFDPILSGGSGSINGTVGPLAPLRVGSGSGSFSTGAPRAFQFGIRVSF